MTEKEAWLIGADSDCDLVVDEPRVSARHCLLTREGEEFLLEDLDSTNGIYVNGRRLKGRCKVSSSDRITLGQATPMPWPKLGRDATVQAKVWPASFADPEIVVTRAKTSDDRRLVVGRDKSCDVVLDYPEISGQHVELNFCNDGSIEIRDLGSTNGTLVGNPGSQVQYATISPDEIISLGPHRFTSSQLAELAGRRLLVNRAVLQPVVPIVQAARSEKSAKSKKENHQLLQKLAIAVLPLVLALLVLWFRPAGNLPKGFPEKVSNVPAEGPVAAKVEELSAVSDGKAETSSGKTANSETAMAISGATLVLGNPLGKDPKRLLQSALGRVVCCDERGGSTLMVGSCMAVENNRFLTTATVVKLVEDLKTSGFPQVRILPSGKNVPLEVERLWTSKQFQKLDTQVEDLLRQQRELTADLEENPNSEQTLEKLKRIAIEGVDLINQKVLWDIGFLEVKGRLEEYFPLPQESAKLRPNQELELNVFPFDIRDSYVDFADPDPAVCISTRVVMAIDDQPETPGYFQAVAELPGLSIAERVLIGGVLVTNRGQPAGIFVRQTPARADNNSAEPTAIRGSGPATPTLYFEFIPIGRVRQTLSEKID